MLNDNELRKFQCDNCLKSKLVLKKVADQQHRGFACDECWTAINKRTRYGYSKCSMQ
jgi:hypothetical protein